MRRPKSGDAKGLFECFEQALEFIGAGNEWTKKPKGYAFTLFWYFENEKLLLAIRKS